MSLKMGKGWYGDSYRHGLAAKGIKTGRTPYTPKLPKEVKSWSSSYKAQLMKNNPAEVRGQQLRIRVLKPKKKARYRVHDVGRRGRLQLTLMDGKVQSYLINLDDYETPEMARYEINTLNLSQEQKSEALKLANNYYKKKENKELSESLALQKRIGKRRERAWKHRKFSGKTRPY